MADRLLLAVLAVTLGGCASQEIPDFEYDILGDEDEELDPLCEEDFSVCGDILVPSPIEGEPRLMAVALYRNIPPAGPPFATLLEDEPPDIAPGGRYKVRLRPVTESGEFYIWANLYMEGGGRFVPENYVDFVGNVPDKMVFDGAPVLFPDFRLTLAEGW